MTPGPLPALNSSVMGRGRNRYRPRLTEMSESGCSHAETVRRFVGRPFPMRAPSPAEGWLVSGAGTCCVPGQPDPGVVGVGRNRSHRLILNLDRVRPPGPADPPAHPQHRAALRPGDHPPVRPGVCGHAVPGLQGLEDHGPGAVEIIAPAIGPRCCVTQDRLRVGGAKWEPYGATANLDVKETL